MKKLFAEMAKNGFHNLRGLKLQGRLPVQPHMVNSLIEEFLTDDKPPSQQKKEDSVFDQLKTYMKIWISEGEGCRPVLNVELEIPK